MEPIIWTYRPGLQQRETGGQRVRTYYLHAAQEEGGHGTTGEFTETVHLLPGRTLQSSVIALGFVNPELDFHLASSVFDC